jgi:hypothetical protein
VCADACWFRSVSPHHPPPSSPVLVAGLLWKHTQHDEPLGLLDALVVGLGVS